MERILRAQTEQEMQALGAALARKLGGGGFVALYGDLGAGKTELVRGAARTFGVERLTSPTFTIVQEYPTKPTLYHFDAYRVADEDELYAIGYTDYLREDALLFMEWANLVKGCLPKERLDVWIEGSGGERRTIRMEAHGTRYETALEQL